MKKNPESKPVEIFAGTSLEAGMLQSMLADAGIEAYLKDDLIGNLAPWQASAGGAGAVKLVISNVDLPAAGPVVEKFLEERES